MKKIERQSDKGFKRKVKKAKKQVKINFRVKKEKKEEIKMYQK